MNIHRPISLLRSAATRYPRLQNFRFLMQRWTHRLLRHPVEGDFRALSFMKLAPGEQAVDVGANRGLCTDAIRLYWPKASIVAFEPNELLAEWLAARFASDPGVSIRNNALGDQPGQFTLYVPFYRRYMFDGLASLKPETATELLTPSHIAGFNAALLSVRELNCTVSRLDDFHLRPGFLKLDVQGFEREVIRGGVETLTAHEPIILMENSIGYHAEDLLERGWHSFALLDGKLVKGRRGTLNTFYMTPARLSRSVETSRIQF